MTADARKKVEPEAQSVDQQAKDAEQDAPSSIRMFIPCHF